MVRALVMETANELSFMYGSEEAHVYIANAVSWSTIAGVISFVSQGTEYRDCLWKPTYSNKESYVTWLILIHKSSAAHILIPCVNRINFIARRYERTMKFDISLCLLITENATSARCT